MPKIELIAKEPEQKAENSKTEIRPVGTEVSSSEDTPHQEVVQHSSEHESRASNLGWMPKERWIEQGHPEEDWKPAKVFLEHGDMIGKIRGQSKELDEMRKALTYAQTQNIQVYERGYQQALVELRQEKRKALAEGDAVHADEIDERIDATKDQINQIRQQTNYLKQASTQSQQVDPEHVEWVGRNPWYNTDKVMSKFADSMAMAFIEENRGQVSASQVRDYVEKEVHKEFPERTGGSGRPKAAPNPDGESRSGSGSNRNASSGSLDSKLSKARSEMTEEQRSIMKTIIKSTGMTEKKYLELYSS